MEPNDLYGLPLERFTEERNALARQLRQDGRRDEAQAVAKLRKPSLAAWAVNQLVRTQPREVEALFRAGDALQKSQADLVSGRGQAEELRRAVDDERAAVDVLTGRARGLLSSEGHELAPAKLEQVSETLHAAALDQEARDLVRDGRLDHELRHIGLGALDSGATASKRAPTKRRASTGRPAKKQTADTRQSQARRDAERAEARARRGMERAQRDLARAQERRDRAAQALGEAEQALRDARAEMATARREHDQAERSLERLRAS
jgi:hypothetical protein